MKSEHACAEHAHGASSTCASTSCSHFEPTSDHQNSSFASRAPWEQSQAESFTPQWVRVNSAHAKMFCSPAAIDVDDAGGYHSTGFKPPHLRLGLHRVSCSAQSAKCKNNFIKLDCSGSEEVAGHQMVLSRVLVHQTDNCQGKTTSVWQVLTTKRGCRGADSALTGTCASHTHNCQSKNV